MRRALLSHDDAVAGLGLRRSLQDPPRAQVRWDGRGLRGRARRDPGQGGAQDDATRDRRRSGSAGPVRPGGAHLRADPEPPRRRGDGRGARERDPLPRDGALGRRRARRRAPGPRSAQRSSRWHHRPAARQGTRQGARRRRRAPRPEARERLPDARRGRGAGGEDPRLRDRQAPPGSLDAHRRGRHAPLHGPGADPQGRALPRRGRVGARPARVPHARRSPVLARGLDRRALRRDPGRDLRASEPPLARRAPLRVRRFSRAASPSIQPRASRLRARPPARSRPWSARRRSIRARQRGRSSRRPPAAPPWCRRAPPLRLEPFVAGGAAPRDAGSCTADDRARSRAARDGSTGDPPTRRRRSPTTQAMAVGRGPRRAAGRRRGCARLRQPRNQAQGERPSRSEQRGHVERGAGGEQRRDRRNGRAPRAGSSAASSTPASAEASSAPPTSAPSLTAPPTPPPPPPPTATTPRPALDPCAHCNPGPNYCRRRCMERRQK